MADLRYMLDTNIASRIIRETMVGKIGTKPHDLSEACMSVISEAELQFGLALKPKATKLNQFVCEFIEGVNILSWDRDAAKIYSKLRASLVRRGKNMSVQDMMIASHAMSMEMVLVTNDRDFRHIDALATEDWTLPQT